MLFVKLGNCLCSFEPPKTTDFLDFWKWKLDPYLIKKKNNPSVVFEFHLTAEDVFLENQLKLVQEVNTGFFAHRVYETVDGGTVWSYVRKKKEEVYLQYFMNARWNQVQLLQDNTNSAGVMAFEYLGKMLPSMLLQQNYLTFHGAFMEYRGNGIIISADSGVGKTTHARLWRDFKNALIVNGDRAVCQKENGIWKGIGLPWSGTSGEQVNRTVPIQALVVLERGKENKANLLSIDEVLPYVFPHILYASWNREQIEKAMELLDDFLQDIPVIRLICQPNKESVDVLESILKEIEK